jgi:tRNA-dihydrouridine synthase B
MIKKVKAAVSVPVIANGDIDTPAKAWWVLRITGADAVMVGRAAQGRPWLFMEMGDFLQRGKTPARPDWNQITTVIMKHLELLYEFYGEKIGVRIARKHIGWYLRGVNGATEEALGRILQAEGSARQRVLVRDALAFAAQEIPA